MGYNFPLIQCKLKIIKRVLFLTLSYEKYANRIIVQKIEQCLHSRVLRPIMKERVTSAPYLENATILARLR